MDYKIQYSEYRKEEKCVDSSLKFHMLFAKT